jgi:pantoate--beta-alanine ligase
MNLKLEHPVAFVPTMGALHAGHQSLIEIAKKFSSNVVVSIFINPLQFENTNDFANYPKSLAADTIFAEAAGASYVWAPTFEEIYPSEPTIIPAGEVGNQFEGVHRFGHFDGVLTVVKRLFDLTNPEFAIFGEKDFQQLFLIKKMVEKLNIPVKIISAPTIRDSHGLALSSRNIRLSKSERENAVGIYRALESANAGDNVESARTKLIKEISAIPNFLLDYAELISEDTFEIATNETQSVRAIVAGWINGIRLIDNMSMSNLGISK